MPPDLLYEIFPKLSHIFEFALIFGGGASNKAGKKVTYYYCCCTGCSSLLQAVSA